MSQKRRKISAFFTGFGSTIQIMPPPRPRTPIFKLGSIEDDAKKLKGDWEKVMKDLTKTIKNYAPADPSLK